MKKSIIIVLTCIAILFAALIATIIVLIVKNRYTGPYLFLHSVEEIQNIQIAHITLEDEYQTFNVDRLDDCIVLADIKDTSEFIKKFNNDVLFSRYLFGDPTHLGHGDYVIKITYNNGDFELIGHYAQCKFDKDEADRNGNIFAGEMFGILYCDEDDFMNFINLYLDEPIVN